MRPAFALLVRRILRRWRRDLYPVLRIAAHRALRQVQFWVLALLIGWFVFAEAPTGAMLAGAALVILAGILIIWREHSLGLERRRQRKATPPA